MTDSLPTGERGTIAYISHYFPLDAAPEAFRVAEERDGKRVVIQP